MTPNEIAATLTACIDQTGTLVLPGDAFGSASMAACFDHYLTNGVLVVSGAVVATTPTAAVVTGDGQGRFGGLAVSGQFTPVGADDVSADIVGVMPSSWTLPRSFSGLAGSAYDQLYFAAGGTLTLHNLADDAGAPGLSLGGALLVAGSLLGVTSFLNGSAPIPVLGAVDVDNECPSFDLCAPVASGVTVGTLSALAFSLQLTSTPYIYQVTNSDGSTSSAHTQSAYIALTTPLSFSAKGETVTFTATMPFYSGPLAGLDVSVSGDLGVVLQDFFAWAGGDLFRGMPPASWWNPADYLTLDRLSFTIVTGSARLSSFALTISTINDWDIIPGLITVSDISQVLTSLDPANLAFISGLLVGTVNLGADGSIARIQVSASVPDFTFAGGLVPGTVVDLSALVTYLIPGAIDVPRITLDYFDFRCQPADASPSYAVNACLSTDWVLNVSPVTVAITNAYVNLSYGSGAEGATAATTGAIGGTVVLDGSVTFSVDYLIPGDFRVVGTFGRISLSSAVARLANIPLKLPSGFDFGLEDCKVVICYAANGESPTLEFQISATVSNLGVLAFTALEVSGNWGYTFGLSMGEVSLSQVPGLGSLRPYDSYFRFQQLVLVVATSDLPGFNFSSDMVDSAGVTMPAGQPLVAGLNSYAVINLAIQRETSLLMTFLDINATLSITLQIAADAVADESSLYATMNGVVNDNVAVQGRFGARLLNGVDLSLFLTGTLTTTLQGQVIAFDVSLGFEVNGAYMSGDYRGTIDFVTVKLSYVVVEIGIDWEGVPTIGFGAQIDIDAFESSIMVLLDSVNPTQSMFVGSISDITLGDCLRYLCGTINLAEVPGWLIGALDAVGLSGTSAFQLADAADSVATALDNRDVAAVSAAFQSAGITIPADALLVIISVATPAELWYVTDMKAVIHYRLVKVGAGQAIYGTVNPQLYVVPQTTMLGTVEVRQGYRANATLDLFGFRSELVVEIEDDQGLSIDVTFSKIDVTYAGSSVYRVTSADGSTGPSLSVSTFYNSNNPNPARQAPHFIATGKVTVLGVVATSVDIDFTAAGGAFSITADVAGLASFAMNGSYSDTSQFSVGGTSVVGVDQDFDFGVLGKVHVVAQVGYQYSVAVESTFEATGTGTGGFFFGNQNFVIESFPLTLSAEPQTALASRQTLGASDVATSDALIDMANGAPQQVYAAVANFFEVSTQWLTWLDAGLVLGVETAEKVGASLEQAYQLAYDAIATQTTDILHYNTDQVTEALQGAGASAQETYDVLVDTLGVSAEQAADAVEKFFTGSGEHLDQILIPGYNDRTFHVDEGAYNDRTLHIDDSGYNDRTVHIDDSGYNDRTLHIDTGGYNDRTLHSDYRVGAHTDFGHIDYGHSDSGHIDYGHVDSGHVDYGHVDSGHIDTGHTDTGHIDTPAVHVDTKL